MPGRAGIVLSNAFALWALAVAATPFFVSAAVPAIVGLALVWFVLRGRTNTRWRKAAIVGLILNGVALAVVIAILAVAA
jgi:hypothetical protein